MANIRTKLGRNDPCWCGSGKKYKRCHLNREGQVSPGKQETFKKFIKLYEKGKCLHPNAGPSTCSGKIIDAHTIQRNGGLSVIAQNGHVYSLLRHQRMFEQHNWDVGGGPNKVGIRDASIFRGFCDRHDNDLFAPIEKQPFRGTPEQIALLGYRAICYELQMKTFALGVDGILRDFDKGQSDLFQQIHQESLSGRDDGVNTSIQELQLLKNRYDKAFFKKDFGDFAYYVVTFNTKPEVMCSGALQSTHDFQGNKIAELGYLNIPADWLAFSLIATDDGGAAVFSWPTDHSRSQRILKTLNELKDLDQPHAIIRFTFEFFENTYFSPDWWDSLQEQVQTRLQERQLRDMVGIWGEQERPRPDDCLLDDGIRAVNWSRLSKLTSLVSTTSSVC